MIVWRKQRVIQNKDAFLGRGRDEDVFRFDSPIHSRDDFPQRGRSGRFGVTAPVLQETFVGTRLEVEKFLDGAGLRVGAR